MEIPRRRSGAYEPRSAVGNILAPTSAPQYAAELRTTPSARPTGGSQAASRPPWATEFDSTPSGRPPSASHQPQSRASSSTQPVDQLDLWTQQQHPHPHHQHPLPGPDPGALSSGRRREDSLYAHVDHHDDGPPGSLPPSQAPAGTAVGGGRAGGAPGAGGTPVAGRRAAVATTASAPPRGGAAVGQRLHGGELTSADARSSPAPAAASRRRVTGGAGSSGPSAGAGGPAGAQHVGASPARARVGAAASRPPPAGGIGDAGAPRSTSTPKPRPAAPPKRSTSITDNVQRDWIDVGHGDRRSSGARGGSAGTNGAGGRWDADPDGSDRGSWLYAGDPSPTDPQQDERPASSGRAGGSSGGGADRMAPRRLVPRPRPQSPPILSSGSGGGGGAGAASDNSFEVTLSPGGVTAAAGGVGSRLGGVGSSSVAGGGGSGGGGGGGGGVSLGHGVTAGSGSAGVGSGRAGARQQPVSAAQSEAARQLQATQEENARLRDQVEHLQRLLTASPSQAAATAGAETPGGSGPGGMTSRRGAPAARPWSAASGTGPDDGAPSLAVAAAAGVTLQQYKSQVIQLQRQVALMSREIEVKSRLGFEAEGVLLEVASRLEELASAAGTPLTADGEEEPLRREQLMQLHKWSKQMLGRLRSEKSQSSKLFTQQAQQDAARNARGGGAADASPWSAPRGGMGGGGGGGDSAAPAPSWVVPFIPAGGNRFLLAGAGGTVDDDLAGAAGGGAGGAGGAGTGPTVAAIACGQAALLADPLLAHRLEMQAAALAPRLAAVAVLLKTQVLPAMPWLGLEAADRLQAEVGEAAEGVAQCADALVSLCSLLPAGAAVFGDGPVAEEPKRRAAEVDAGRDSWLYSAPGLVDAPEPPSPVVTEDGVANLARLQAAIAPLLRDRKAGGKALADILEPLRAKSQSTASKRALLESELRFASRASALHAEHVSHLMMSVGRALEECRGAKDAAAIKSYFAASTAVRQVLEAADALELHPCENCLKELVEVIRGHRDSLDRLPELLVNAPAADVEGRLLGKIEDLHQGFRKAISRLEAQKRHHQDVLLGVGHPASTTADGDYESDGDGDGEDGGSTSDAAGPRTVGGNGGSARRLSSDDAGGSGAGSANAPTRLPPRQQPGASPEPGAPKPGKPPKPKVDRPGWQD